MSLHHGNRFVDLAGQRFGRLAIIAFSHMDERGEARWRARCDCGGQKSIRGSYLRSRKSQSCGCLKNELTARRNVETLTTHGQSASLGNGLKASPEYRSWQAAINRCENTKHHGFHRYGGRGISVCERWRHSFENFLADMGPRPKGTTLDRIDNDGNYEPGNCRWATPKEQIHNRSKANG